MARFVKVKNQNIPKWRKRTIHKLEAVLTEFVNMNCKCAWVHFDEGEYASLKSAQNSWNGAAKKYGIPAKLIYRRDEAYLIRTDM